MDSEQAKEEFWSLFNNLLNSTKGRSISGEEMLEILKRSSYKQSEAKEEAFFGGMPAGIGVIDWNVMLGLLKERVGAGGVRSNSEPVGGKPTMPTGPIPKEKEKQKNTMMVWIFLTIIVVAAIMVIALIPSLPKPIPETAAEKKKSDSVLNAPKESNWVYETESDQMGQGETRLATTRSINTLSLGFPYQGMQHATLSIRRSPRFGKDVYFSIEQGQIILSYSNEQVLVQFDDDKPVWFPAVKPADYSTTTIFLNDYKSIVRRMLRLKWVRVEVTIHDAGNHIMQFNTANLKWDRP